MMQNTNDIRILAEVPLVSPQDLARRIPMSDAAAATVLAGRNAVQAILGRKDRRMLGVVGPCSIHDPDAALEYASKLAALSRKVEDSLFLVMRVYFEKPRTALGWRGLIVDPMMDGSYDIARGISTARKLLMEINGMGLPSGTEVLDPIIPQYIAELMSWGSIGARTTESQTHREIASGLSMPIGFKNSTDGDVQIAINAILSSRHQHSFVGIDHSGSTCVLRTSGNQDSHLILRGGRSGPNYHPADVERACELLRKAGIEPAIIVDCSHGNSVKRPENQVQVIRSLLDQRSAGGKDSGAVVGFMIESNLEGGCQPLDPDHSKLKRGVSVTDPCLGWTETESLLLEAADRLRAM